VTLLSRLKRRLGYDTTIEKTAEYPLYEFTASVVGGDEVSVVATSYRWKEGAVQFREPDNQTWAAYTTDVLGGEPCKPGLFHTHGLNVVRELGNVTGGIDRERIGRTCFAFVIDWADHSIVELTRVDEKRDATEVTEVVSP